MDNGLGHHWSLAAQRVKDLKRMHKEVNRLRVFDSWNVYYESTIQAFKRDLLILPRYGRRGLFSHPYPRTPT